MMTTEQILHFLQKDMHSTIMATVDEEGLPVTCVIDMMLSDENGLYFLTARGNAFYQRFSYGNVQVKETGYRILEDKCIGCGRCVEVCPQNCIRGDCPKKIDRSHCLHCGNCFRECPVKAVIKLGA